MNKKHLGFILFFILFFILSYTLFKCYTVYENFSTDKIKDYLEGIDHTNIIYNDKSKYQTITIIEGIGIKNDNIFLKSKNKCLLLNDEIQLCTDYEQKYHEFIVHFPAAYISSLKTVLIIGGGDLMTLREVMKYNVQRVDMLELDEMVINASLNFFKESNISKFENDKRVHIHIGDAFKTIHNLKDVKYDLIIADLTEDSNTSSPAETSQFWKVCKSLMKPSGILIKNGYTSKDMSKKIKKRKENIFNYLVDIFKNVGIYKIITPEFYEDSYYKFIMCSDFYKLDDNILNNETKSLALKKYNYKDHSKYIHLKNVSFS